MSMKGHTAAACILLGAAAAMAQPPLSVDPSFQTQIQWQYVADLEFLPDGKILVSGHMNFPGMIMPPFRGLARLNADGSLDDSFTRHGGGGQIRLWENSYYVGIGQSVLRYSMDGDIDPTYSATNHFSYYQGGEYHLFPDGSVLLTGLRDLRDTADWSVIQYNNCLAKLGVNGEPDPTYTHRSCFPGSVRVIRPTPDGKFLLSGTMSVYDDQPVGRVLRVFPDGSLDTTFQSSFTAGRANDFYFYPDGRILVGGFFLLPEYPNDTLELLRLMPDGSVDMSWPVMDFRIQGTYFADVAPVGGIFEVEPGKLILTGQFKELYGEEVGGIVMIDTAGNVLQQYFTGLGADTLISPPSIITREVFRTERAPDGSLYIYGSYHGFDDGHAYHAHQRMITKLYPLNVGVEEQPGAGPEGALHVWPNPAQEVLHVELPEAARRAMVTVRDALGREVLQQALRSPGSPMALDIRALPPGLYTVEVMDNAVGRWLAKWIKE